MRRADCDEDAERVDATRVSGQLAFVRVEGDDGPELVLDAELMVAFDDAPEWAPALVTIAIEACPVDCQQCP